MITHSNNMDIQGYTQMLLSRNELECAELMQDAVLPDVPRGTNKDDSINRLVENTIDLDPGYSKAISDSYWQLL